jgi:superfamily II DNA or RNA helicase
MIDEKHRIIFYLSPSSINLFNESELLFYYSMILNAEPDTEVTQVYGDAGSLVHEVLEKYAESLNDKTKLNVIKLFDDGWDEKQLNIKTDMYDRVLNKSKYLKAVNNGVRILNCLKDCEFKTEQEISFPLIDDDKFLINVKGIIDLQVFDDNKIDIIDWKTSSSCQDELYEQLEKEEKIKIIDGIIHFVCEVNEMPPFAIQLLHYSYIVHRQSNIVPSTFKVEYVKINKTKAYHFTDKQIKDYKLYIDEFVNKIMLKGSDINKYKIGDINSIFNQHKQKCLNEYNRRNNDRELIIVEKDNKLILFKNFDNRLISMIDKKYSYLVEGYQFSEKFKKRIWDGKKHFLRKSKDMSYLPIGFKPNLTEFIQDYISHFKLDLTLKYIDKNNYELVHTSSVPDKLSDIELYDFQKEAVEECLKNKRGIVFASVGSGKTEIIAEVIRRLDIKTLFLIHRKELMIQTYDRFVLRGLNKNKLLGMMDSSNCNYNNFINIGMIQTIYNRLQDKDMIAYLREVKLVIVDECHHAIASSYKSVLNKINAPYVFGLTGSIPEYKKYELELKSAFGNVLYNIDSNTLMNKDIITRPEVYMFRVDHEFATGYWPDLEKSCIINNKKRNDKIKEICDREDGVKVIIVKKIEHGKILNELISDSIFTYSGSEDEERQRIMKELEKGEVKVLISTLIGEGVSVNRIKHLIIACGMGRNSIAVIQNAGRVMRKHYENGEQVSKKLYDFYDENVEYLEEHSQCRKKEYEKYAEVIFCE